MQINVRAGLTFASALRSILRSDPDVVMVGEVRDGETAKMAIEAALTGHLVLSTLHTNDAPSTLTRLNEMGVEPFLTGSAVSAVLAQRLARKLCTHCCEMYTPSVEELIEARVAPDVAASSDGMVLYRKRGCPRCNQTGYRGRIGIFQLLLMNEGLAELAVRKAGRDEVEREAMSAGMQTLWDDGMAKVAGGPDVDRRAGAGHGLGEPVPGTGCRLSSRMFGTLPRPVGGAAPESGQLRFGEKTARPRRPRGAIAAPRPGLVRVAQARLAGFARRNDTPRAVLSSPITARGNRSSKT